MKRELILIDIPSLALMIVPVVVVLFIFQRWTSSVKSPIYANLRMLVQLTLIGYLLTYIFKTENFLVVFSVIGVMMVAASSIALRPIKDRSRRHFKIALFSIALSGLLILAIVTQLVLGVNPWYAPYAVIPLAGMIFSAAMNAVSLAAERFESELGNHRELEDARATAFEAALIPIMNTLFAVGLVALPGMMTGQILSGVDPLIAVRYQIMVMAMVFSSSGISAASYLFLINKKT